MDEACVEVIASENNRRFRKLGTLIVRRSLTPNLSRLGPLRQPSINDGI